MAGASTRPQGDGPGSSVRETLTENQGGPYCSQVDENVELARRFRPMTDAEMADLESLGLA